MLHTLVCCCSPAIPSPSPVRPCFAVHLYQREDLGELRENSELGFFQAALLLREIPAELCAPVQSIQLPALGFGETCRSLGISPVNTDNRLKGELDELIFIPGLRIRLAFKAAAAGIYYGELWARLQVEPFLANPAFGPSSCVTAHTHALGRISTFSGVSGEARAGLCLKCKSTGPGDKEISFWTVLSVLVNAGQGTERLPFCERKKSQI